MSIKHHFGLQFVHTKKSWRRSCPPSHTLSLSPIFTDSPISAITTTCLPSFPLIPTLSTNETAELSLTHTQKEPDRIRPHLLIPALILNPHSGAPKRTALEGRGIEERFCCRTRPLASHRWTMKTSTTRRPPPQSLIAALGPRKPQARTS